MLITKNGVKNLVFEFILQDYENKARYGNRPTTLEHFYNNWLIRRLVKNGIIDAEESMDQTKKKSENRYLDVTWQAVEDLMRDRLIKRWLHSAQDLSRWDVFVPTEKGIETWEKYGRLLIIPSNLVDSLREELPRLSPDAEVVLDFLNEAVYCFFYNLLLGCSENLSCAGRRTLHTLFESFLAYQENPAWADEYLALYDDVERADMIRAHLNELILSGKLAADYAKVHPGTDVDMQEELKNLNRSIDFMISIIGVAQKQGGLPHPGILKIEETYRAELMLGYLVGSYSFFRLSFIICEIFDSMVRYREGREGA